jgi:hypothetical protein
LEKIHLIDSYSAIVDNFLIFKNDGTMKANHVKITSGKITFNDFSNKSKEEYMKDLASSWKSILMKYLIYKFQIYSS